MSTDTAAPLVNLLGFITGLVLYAMLLWMALTSGRELNRLILLTGFLGFVWNSGALAAYGLTNLGIAWSTPLLLAGAFGALCFLPSVVVHSALAASEKVGWRENLVIAIPAYAMSSIAAVMHVYAALTSGEVPSQLALRGVTVGFAVLIFALLIVTRGQENRGPILWVVAMSVFAVSALHLSEHQGTDPWWMQLAGHHASLPLALLILYQDFRFALADIFLKRALAFILLAGLTFGVFAFGMSPLLQSKPMNEQSTALVLAMWVATALTYPSLRRGAAWFVDKVVLKRVDYTELVMKLSRDIDKCASPRSVLDETARILAPAVNASSIEWLESATGGVDLRVEPDRRSARVAIPTSEHPHYVLHIRDLMGGRRLLSDDFALLERAGLIVARRIDAVRSMQERYRHELQEQEMRKLAAEAELRALRAQINPHFLFNALTTIGYLIQSAPQRALGTLLKLSGLLRGLLKSSGEFVTLGEELDIIETYLDIERERFEDRLRVRIEVPVELRRIRIPALVIQPLIENAIKHGISESRAGGEVCLSAQLDENMAVITVADTGAGMDAVIQNGGRSRGMGLSNVEQRLRRYGASNPLTIESITGTGTTVVIRVPLQPGDALVQTALMRSR